MSKWGSFQQEMPLLLTYCSALKNVLSFITTQCPWIGFSVHPASRPELWFSSRTSLCKYLCPGGQTWWEKRWEFIESSRFAQHRVSQMLRHWGWKQFSSVQSLSRVQLFATPWITAHQASLSITNSRSLLKLMPIESVMPSSHLILCHPLLLLPPIPPGIGVFSNESTLHMRWPKYWSFSLSISPSNEHPGLISFRGRVYSLGSWGRKWKQISNPLPWRQGLMVFMG